MLYELVGVVDTRCLVRRAKKVAENKEKSGSIDEDDYHMGRY